MIHIYSDFDGTISARDTGTFLFDQYGFGFEKRKCLDQMVLNGHISFREAVTEMWESVNSLSLEEATDLIIKEIELDPGFLEFYEFAIKKGIPLTILSSGLNPLLKSYLDHYFPKGMHETTNIIANDIKIYQNRWMIQYYDTTIYGHDKGSHLRQRKLGFPNDKLIFIGDGISDLPAAKAADVVFAKRGKDLETYCIREGISFIGWLDFSDIKNHIDILINE